MTPTLAERPPPRCGACGEEMTVGYEDAHRTYWIPTCRCRPPRRRFLDYPGFLGAFLKLRPPVPN